MRYGGRISPAGDEVLREISSKRKNIYDIFEVNIHQVARQPCDYFEAGKF